MPKAESKKHANELFISSHETMYGLKIMERCPSTSRVISVRCQFCVYFSVETDPTKHEIRGPKTTKMAWTGSFRSDKYQAHHKRQHPSQWAIYNVCSLDEKKRFFDGKIPHANTMLPHINVGSAATPLIFNILLPIVDVFIADMFFHPDDHGGTTQTTALQLFKRVFNTNGSESESESYQVVISNRDQFRLVIANLSRGMSFRQCAHNINDIKEILGIIFKVQQFSN